MVSELAIKESFARAKRDISVNSDRIEELEKENMELKGIIYSMKDQLENPEVVVNEAEPINIKNGDVKATIREVLSEMDVVSEKTKDDIAKFNLTKKDIIKAKILEVVESQTVMLPRLKEIIVDNNKYCSKASFYRYFEELKAEEKLCLMTINNKTIVRSSRIEIISST